MPHFNHTVSVYSKIQNLAKYVGGFFLYLKPLKNVNKKTEKRFL